MATPRRAVRVRSRPKSKHQLTVAHKKHKAHKAHVSVLHKKHVATVKHKLHKAHTAHEKAKAQAAARAKAWESAKHPRIMGKFSMKGSGSASKGSPTPAKKSAGPSRATVAKRASRASGAKVAPRRRSSGKR